MRINDDDQREVMVDGTGVKRIECHNFLGTIINTNGDCKYEISHRLALAQKAATILDETWKKRDHAAHKNSFYELHSFLYGTVWT